MAIIPNPYTVWIKPVLAVVIALAIMWAVVEFRRRGERITELEGVRDTYKQAVQTFDTANKQWAHLEDDRKAAAERDAAERKRIADIAAAETARAAKDTAAAEKRAEDWRDRYREKPANCAAALAALDAACPTLRGF